MTDINAYYQQAQLAMGAYAANLHQGDSGSTNDSYVDKLIEAGMSRSQAELFADIYSVVDQHVSFQTGLSVTVFSDSSGSKYMAVGGTEPTDLLDWQSDFAILTGLVGGYFPPQYTELRLYYQQLINQGLLSSSEVITVTGHSLGGFLAQLFSVDHADVVTNTYTYNAPGIGGFVSQLGELFGITDGTIDGSAIVNIQSIGLSATAGFGTLIGLVETVFIEDQAPNLIDNHRILQLADAIAVYDLLSKVDASKDMQQITQILKNASNMPEKSLENIVNALGEIYHAGEYVNVGNRDALYTRIKDISESQLFAQSIGFVNVVSMSEFTPDSYAVAAAADLGFLYALEKLNPFAIVGDNGLYPELDTSQYTQQYLQDRAYLLENQLIRAASDYPLSEYGSEFDGQGQQYVDINLHFVDADTNYDAWKYHPASLSQKVSITFGSDSNADQLIGTDEIDHLYGRGGDDILIQSANGLDDNKSDYLEGGIGNDIYIVGGGDRILDLDGVGTVIFNGFTLHGGLGDAQIYQQINQRFTYTLSGETLTVLDTVENETLTIEHFSNSDLGLDLIDTQPVNKQQSIITIGRHDATINTDDDVTVINEAGVDMVQTWGQIQDAIPTSTDSDPLIGNHYDFAFAIDEIHTGAGNDNVTVVDIKNNPDIWFFGGVGNDSFLAYGMDDGSGASQAGATIYGESGDDNLNGSYLADWVDGGADHDMISGRGGDDILLGDVGNDLVCGGDGQDDIFGGEGNDWLYGGAQSDFIEGGSGNDRIYGDTEIGSVIDATGTERRALRTWDGANEAIGFYPADTWWVLPDTQTVLDLPATRDVAVAEVGDDILSGGAGSDAIFGGGGADDIYGGDDADLLAGEAGADRLFGDAGNDLLFGDIYQAQYDYDQEIINSDYSASLDLTVTQIRRQYQDPVDVAGDDDLYGGLGIDRLYGGGGNDVLNGGADNDYLAGGTGDDSYVFDLNWGVDTLREEDGVDTIRFGAGILATDISVTANGADLVLSDTDGNEIHIKDWYNGTRIEHVVFSDGSAWSEADLTAAAQHQTGDDGDNDLSGIPNEANVLDGGAGNDQLTGGIQADTLIGGDGNDVLHGGGGDDQLLGGAGADIYEVGNEAGAVTLVDDATDGSVNTVRFAQGLQLTDITSMQSGSDLVLNWNSVAGSATIKGYYDNPAAWRFELDIGLTVPNAFLDDPSQLSVISEEQQAYQQRLQTDLLATVQSPSPVSGNVTLTVPQAGSIYDLLAYSNDLSLGIGFSGLTATVNDTLKHETTVVIDQMQGTDGSDTLSPVATSIHQINTRSAYLWLSDVTQTTDTTYTATIEKSSYDRPAFIPETELANAGDLYGNILRIDVTVSSETYPVTILDSGAGNDRIGNEIQLPYGSIASTFKDGSFFASDYYKTQIIASGGDGFDALFGGARGDYLEGGNGLDRIYGYGGDDVLVGGEGDDSLYGHAGSDRYVIDFSQSGHDYIEDNGLFTDGDVTGLLIEGRGMSSSEAVEFLRTATDADVQDLKDEFGLVDANDTVRVNVNLSDASLSWVPPNNEERIGIRIQPQGNADASVTVWMRGPIDFLGFGIETFEFADVTLTQDELIAALPPFPSVWEFEGTANADSLEGTDLEDILVGKAGDDSLEGRAGNDVYLFNAGDGFDYIYDYNGEDDAGIDTLSIGMGINPADVKAAYWIDDYGDETYYALFLYFDDTGTDGVFLDWLYTYNDGVDVYPENTNIEYIQFLGANGGQIFDLAAIVQARVAELTDAYDQDTPIQLFTPEVLDNFDVTATVGLAGGTAAYNYATTGDIHTAPQTPTLYEIQGTGASDTLIGTDGADRIDGGSGNDTIDGGLGNDTIIGGAGSDTLSGGDGDDTFMIDGIRQWLRQFRRRRRGGHHSGW